MPVRLYGLLRLEAAGTIFTAIIVQFQTSVLQHDADPVNFFSYFTILSNVFLACVLLVAALRSLGNKKSSKILDYLRGAATVYMATTGIVYALLLSHYDLGLTLPWVNFVLHQLAPILALVDWIATPPGKRLPTRTLWTWIVFPFMYVIYSLIRGPIVHWYPYPFLDPSTGGYGKVFSYSIGIGVSIALLVIMVAWVGNVVNAKSHFIKGRTR